MRGKSLCSLIILLLYSAAAAKLLQSCPTLCDPIDSSPPGSSVPGILQAIILEWVAISFSKYIQLILTVYILWLYMVKVKMHYEITR